VQGITIETILLFDFTKQPPGDIHNAERFIPGQINKLWCAARPACFRMPELDHQPTILATNIQPDLPDICTTFTGEELKML